MQRPPGGRGSPSPWLRCRYDSRRRAELITSQAELAGGAIIGTAGVGPHTGQLALVESRLSARVRVVLSLALVPSPRLETVLCRLRVSLSCSAPTRSRASPAACSISPPPRSYTSR